MAEPVPISGTVIPMKTGIGTSISMTISGIFWFYYDDEGDLVILPGNPPGIDPNWTYPQALPHPSRTDLGIVPDQDGNVSPSVFVLNYHMANTNSYEFSVDDVMDFYMVLDEHWELPFDVDEDFLASIGEQNISFSSLAYEDNSPEPVLLRMHGITLGLAIEFMSRMGFTEVHAQTAWGTHALRLNGSFEEYTAAELYLNDDLVDTIPLR